MNKNLKSLIKIAIHIAVVFLIIALLGHTLAIFFSPLFIESIERLIFD